tara:strand:- start:540 stop:1262 length:723 start_codon:yes stop_codon:yes gene_type:complete
MKLNNKILVTGGNGRFGKVLKKLNYKNFIFPTKKQLDITNIKSIRRFIIKTKPKVIIHLAGLSRPLSLHEKNPVKSISLNIIGTSNLVIEAKKLNIKFIYFSSNYVYPGNKGNYKETDPLLPSSKYAWSKLGGEAAVHIYDNSLILRVCMTEKPFIHKKALSDVYLNFIFQDEIAKVLPKLIKYKGIINVGGSTRTVYQFAKKTNPKIKKILSRQIKGVVFKKKMSMNISKFKKIYKKKI